MTGAFAGGIAEVLDIILKFIQLLVIASIICSWVSADPNNQIVQLIYRSTEPLYKPFRRLTKRIPGPLDWAPVFVLLVIVFLQYSVVSYLRVLARSEMRGIIQ